MAGFYIVMMAFAALVIVGIIYLIFQVCAILGIAFNIAVFVRSDKFIKSRGGTNFLNAGGFGATKGLSAAGTVFTVISCIVGVITLILIIAFAFDAANNPELDFDLLSLLIAIIIGCGTHIACFILKIISAKRFGEAKAYREELCRGSAPFREGTTPQTVFTTAYTEDSDISQCENPCPHCGTENNSANKFCVKCGETLKK